MGTSHYAYLAYGVDLGDSDEIRIEETGEFGSLDVPWVRRDDEGWPQEQFGDAITRRLYELIPDSSPDGLDVWNMHDLVERHYGVQILTHGWPSEGQPSWVLAAHCINVEGGEVTRIDPDELKEMAREADFYQKITAVFAALGINPIDPKPGWLLLADR